MLRVTDAVRRARTMLISQIGEIARYACSPAFSQVNIGNLRMISEALIGSIVPHRAGNREAARYLRLRSGREAAMSKTTHAGADAWRNNLIVSASGAPKPLLANAVTAFRDCMTWHNVLAFDVFGVQTVLDSAPPWYMGASWDPCLWSPQDDLLATNWLQQQGISVNVPTTAQAVELVARDRSFHPVIDYLHSLEHDGKPRLNTMLSKYFGAEQSPYTAAVGLQMMVSAVARIFDPGCKVDTVPVIESSQGTKKSTALKVLFSPWFTDDIEQLGSKDAAMQTAGVWCIELGELDAMSKAEISKVKAFISRAVDRFRPPYGRRVIERPRECILVGTTNDVDYLKDATGARRFRPFEATRIDVEGLTRDRDMIWAEARIQYDAGVKWWFADNKRGVAVERDAKTEQEARYQVDPWEKPIADYLDSRVHQPPDRPAYQVDIHFVFNQALEMNKDRWNQPAMNRVARCMKRLGWSRKQVTIEIKMQDKTEKKRVWKYVRSPTDDELVMDDQFQANKPADSDPDNNVTTLRAHVHQ